MWYASMHMKKLILSVFVVVNIYYSIHILVSYLDFLHYTMTKFEYEPHIQKIMDNSEVTRFLNQDIAPSYLSSYPSPSVYKLIATDRECEISRHTLDETIFRNKRFYPNEEKPENIKKVSTELLERFHTLEDSLSEIQNSLHTQQYTCPICIEDIQDTGYIVLQCGHRMCNACMFQNLSHNRSSGNRCPECRSTIITANNRNA